MINETKMEAVISASKFLDLLCCVVPAISHDSTRPMICGVKLEILPPEYAIRAIATNGLVLAAAERALGFSTADQEDFEDVEARRKIKRADWLISSIDAELLVMALKKLGVKRSKEDESDGRYYITLTETETEIDPDAENKIKKKRLSISILGMSQVILEPDLLRQEFPDWKKLVPCSTESSSRESISFDLTNFLVLNKCWGGEKIFLSFFNGGRITKINRNTQDGERISDFILLMPSNISDDEKDSINDNQMNLFN